MRSARCVLCCDNEALSEAADRWTIQMTTTQVLLVRRACNLPAAAIRCVGNSCWAFGVTAGIKVSSMLMASFLLNYALLRKYVRMYVGRKHAADLLPRSAGGIPKQATDPSFLPR